MSISQRKAKAMARQARSATDKQLDFIKVLAHRAGFVDEMQAINAAGVVSRNPKYDLGFADASIVIEELQGGLKPEPEPEPTVTIVDGAGLSGNEAVSLIGKKATITYMGTEGGGPYVRVVDVEYIQASKLDKTPAITGYTPEPKSIAVRLSHIVGVVVND